MEIKETPESDLFARLTELCRKLAFGEKKDIILRRNILKEIENIIKKEMISFQEEDQNAFENILKYIVSSVSDDNERCREISVNILNVIIDHSCLSENLFSLIFGALAVRLGKTDEREPSEEVRLMEVHLLLTLIKKYEGDILKYLNDLTKILSSCIVDDCPEIKRKSCECTSVLACKHKTHFHMVSSSLLKPLLQTISHQHFKTR
ncbi:HEAT repeat-containing protein 2, partial [Stegodyphus mimosarum]